MIAFWLFMLCADLLVPAVMIGFGRMFLKNPPRNINASFGYRTAMSMKNQDTWDFAHQYCGRLWYRCGLVMLPLSVVPLLFVLSRDIGVIGNRGLIVAGVQLAVMLGTVFPVERALKRTFDERGRHARAPGGRGAPVHPLRPQGPVPERGSPGAGAEADL